MVDLPVITTDEAKEIVSTKTAPRVTEQLIINKIAKVEYIQQDTLTICVITLVNGWKQIGKAAPADARNYDPEVGKRYAYDDAFKPLWHLEGYLLRDRLWRIESGQVPHGTVDQSPA